MQTTNKVHKLTTARKVYQRPALKALGSVQQLTLKLGSAVDMGQPNNGFA